MELEGQFTKLMQTNVVANIHLFNLFLPQVLKGRVKKVVTITSGMGDMDFVKDYDISESPLYAISKAAVNMVTAKFSAQYKQDGVLFLSICPGMVDVGHFETGKPHAPTAHCSALKPAQKLTSVFSIVAPEQQPGLEKMVEKFKRYSPTFTGPDLPPESIKAVLSVVENSSIENGAAGAYLSHFGTKRWV